MWAGVGAADVTPRPGQVLQGHYTTRVSTGVLRPLEVRALVVRGRAGTRACLVTVDAIGVSCDSTARIRDGVARSTGIRPDHVMVCASHTHCAPPAVRLLGLDPSPDFVAAFESAAVSSATAALAAEVPVYVGTGCAAAHFNVNRRPIPGDGPPAQFSANYGGVVDKRVRVLSLEHDDGRPLAVLFHYSCHPTTKAGSEGLISPDYPGVARAHIEHELGCRALFLPGCFANIRPLVLDDHGQFVSASREKLEEIGLELGQAACRAARAARPLPTGLSTDASAVDEDVWARETDLVLPFADPMTPDQLDAVTRDPAPAAIAVKAPWARRVQAMVRDGALPADERTAMQALRLGPVTLVSIPGEPVQEMGYEIERRAAPAAARLGDVWPVGYTNDMVGYLVTERHKREGGYEPTAYPWFDRPAPFRDEERLITDTAARLLGI